MAEPETEFDRYPDLHELVDRGGRPGITYMLALSENVSHWQKDGWELIGGCAALSIVGPKGVVSMQLMGQGEPIVAASPESWEAVAASPESWEALYFIDTDADLKTGLWKETKVAVKDPTPSKGDGSSGPREVDARNP
jgi:hypothetical protein